MVEADMLMVIGCCISSCDPFNLMNTYNHWVAVWCCQVGMHYKITEKNGLNPPPALRSIY